MDIRDLKRYSGYMPIRWWHEEIINFIDGLIPRWSENLFVAKWTGRRLVKMYYGERMEVKLIEKYPKSSFRLVPMAIWTDLSKLDVKELSQDTWRWIREQKKISFTKLSRDNLPCNKNDTAQSKKIPRRIGTKADNMLQV